MPWYELTKALHFFGLFALIGFFIVHTRISIALRAAKTTREVRTFATMIDTARPMVPSGAVLLLVSGIIMTGLRWRQPYPFTLAGLATIMVITPVVIVMVKKQVATIRGAVGDTDAMISDAMRATINTPAQWGTIMACNTAAVAVMLSMVIKPSWPWVAGLLVVLPTIGFMAASGVARKAGTALKT